MPTASQRYNALVSERVCNIDDLQELYEPLWDEIYQRSKSSGFSIRSIWISDVAQQGYSSILNEDKLGNDRRPANPLFSLGSSMNSFLA